MEQKKILSMDQQDVQLQIINTRTVEIADKLAGILSLLKGNELNKNDRGMIGDIEYAITKVESVEKLVSEKVNVLEKMVVEKVGILGSTVDTRFDNEKKDFEAKIREQQIKIDQLEKWRLKLVNRAFGVGIAGGFGIWELLRKIFNIE
jgi:hypothetical protein